jgi:beta-mannosidase
LLQPPSCLYAAPRAGDLLTDLENAGIIGDPLYNKNFKPDGVPMWDSQNWTYSRSFDLDIAVRAAPSVQLVFDGIKMAADISLNGVYLGFANDQFLRYTFDATAALKPAGNVLTVTFTTSSDPRNAQARYMACSGGWVRCTGAIGRCGGRR